MSRGHLITWCGPAKRTAAFCMEWLASNSGLARCAVMAAQGDVCVICIACMFKMLQQNARPVALLC